jgi:hypothetical protein
MNRCMSLEISRIRIASKFQNQFNILTFFVHDCKVKWCGIFAINLIHTDIEFFAENEYA